MATNEKKSNNDSFDINELAYLDEDITPEFIEKLQHDAEIQAMKLNSPGGKLDVNMFEDIRPPQQQTDNTAAKTADNQADANSQADEVQATENPTETSPETSDIKDEQNTKTNDKAGNENKELGINAGFDENFIKKYKAKLNKQTKVAEDDTPANKGRSNSDTSSNSGINTGGTAGVNSGVNSGANSGANINPATNSNSIAASEAAFANDNGQSIEELTKGNITEKAITQEQQAYNESLDYDDDNIKYSKYVIYIDPENIEFINSLTVKERKNLINKVLYEQGILVLSKKRADFIKSVLKHLFLAIITVALMLPVIYKVFNFSLEATIDNYHRSQSNFQTLYREKGKIKPIR